MSAESFILNAKLHIDSVSRGVGLLCPIYSRRARDVHGPGVPALTGRQTLCRMRQDRAEQGPMSSILDIDLDDFGIVDDPVGRLATDHQDKVGGVHSGW